MTPFEIHIYSFWKHQANRENLISKKQKIQKRNWKIRTMTRLTRILHQFRNFNFPMSFHFPKKTIIKVQRASHSYSLCLHDANAFRCGILNYLCCSDNSIRWIMLNFKWTVISSMHVWRVFRTIHAETYAETLRPIRLNLL